MPNKHANQARSAVSAVVETGDASSAGLAREAAELLRAVCGLLPEQHFARDDADAAWEFAEAVATQLEDERKRSKR